MTTTPALPDPESLRSTRFPVARRASEGYDAEGVDRLIDALVLALEQGRPLTPTVQGVRLRQARRGAPGYRMREVDDFLDGLSSTRSTSRVLDEPRPGLWARLFG